MRMLCRKGINISAIARELNCSRTTIYKYLLSDRCLPKYRKKKARMSKLDPFKELIKQKLSENPHTTVKLYEIICKLGYQGQLTTVRNYVRQIKKYERKLE